MLDLQLFSTYPGVMFLDQQNPTLEQELESKFCYAQLQCLPGFTIPPVHFIYVMDTSGSMQGHRIHNAKLGLKASCMYLPEETTMSILSFNDFARVLHKGKNPYKGHADLDALDSGLQAYGGTSISKALELTLDHIEEIFSVSVDKSIVVLFMTDGEDPQFAAHLQQYKTNNLLSDDKDGLLDRMVRFSGVFTNFVGISTDAASADMAFLAEISNGTFVSVDHHDIVDVMGSMLGLSKERIPHRITMDLKACLNVKSFEKVQENQPCASSAFEGVLEKDKYVPLRTSIPSKLFFQIGGQFQATMAMFPHACDSLEIFAHVKIYSFGTTETLFCEHNTSQTWKLLLFSECEHVGGLLNYECISLKIQKEWGHLNAECALLLQRGFLEGCLEKMNGLHVHWQSTWNAFFQDKKLEDLVNPTFEPSRIDMEKIGAKIQEFIKTISDAEAGEREMASLQCRMLSNAATDRNCSMTLESQEMDDDLSLQVATRNSIRQLSQTF